MDPQTSTTTATTTPATTPASTAASHPTQPLPPPLPQSQPPSSSSSSTPPPTTPNPNPNSNPTPKLSAPPRPQPIHRPWQHPNPHAHFQHFSSLPSSSSSPSAAPSATVATSAPQQRGSVAIGVPSSHAGPSTASFSSSFGQPFGGLSRAGVAVNVADSVANSNNSQVRQGVQGVGMMGPGSSTSQMRPGGIAAHHQQRPVQSSLRPALASPSNQSPTTQNFQGHSFMRSPVGPPASSAPNTSQSIQSHNQPWMSSASQAKPPLPSPSYRPQMSSPTLQQRSHVPQQHHSLPTNSQQQTMQSMQPQQSLPARQPEEHYGQPFPPSRVPQSSPHPQQITRIQSAAVTQKISSPTAAQPNTAPPMQNRTANAENDETGNRILSKRSIHELVSQIDPSERLDPEVEDILADIADDFVESITTFGCSLAKHRKSDTLEAKDILLHLERNWNMTLPGFGGDEIKSYRKPVINDIHKERLAVIKKSILASEMANTRNSVGQAAGHAKSNLTKTSTNTMVSPNLKIREVT